MPASRFQGGKGAIGAADDTADEFNVDGTIVSKPLSFVDWGGRERSLAYEPLDTTPLACNGENTDFAVRLASMPGRHSGDQVHKVKKGGAFASLCFIIL